jgi:5-methylcytosine-specific restriction endonuclease McrA
MTHRNDIPPADERAIAVRLRDNEQCTVCNRSQSETNLEVHAIIPDDEEAASKLANFVLLCEKHHRKAHRATEVQHGR